MQVNILKQVHLEQERSAEVEEIDVERGVVVTTEVKVFVREEHRVLSTGMVYQKISLYRVSSCNRQTDRHRYDQRMSYVTVLLTTKFELFVSVPTCIIAESFVMVVWLSGSTLSVINKLLYARPG